MGSTVTSARVAGALLVERGLVTPAQLAEALEHQRAQGGELDEIIERLFGVPGADVVAVLRDRDGATRVDIGSILLASGAVDEERLAAARARSAASGQPVGPILVEMGAITRLDLASALADQWSDSPAQILPPANARERAAAPRHDDESVDDLRFAMAALEASVRTARATGDDGQALEELLRREDALAARIAALEHAIDQPVEADPALVAEIRGIAEGLETLQTSLRSVATTDDVASLAAAVADVGHLRSIVESLALRVDGAAPADALERALGETASLAARLGDLETTRGELATLGATVAEVANRPTADPALCHQLDELARAVEALDVLPGRADELAQHIAALSLMIDELAQRPAAEPGLVERVDELSARLGQLGHAVDELAARPPGDPAFTGGLDEVRQQLDELAQRPAGDPALAGRVEQLGGVLDALRLGVDELAARPPGDPALAGRVEELAGVLEALRLGLEEVAHRPHDPALTERVDGLATTLAGLGERIAELPHSAADPTLSVRVSELAADVDRTAEMVAALPGVAADVAALTDRLASFGPLREDLGQIRVALASLETRPAPDDALARRVDELAARVEALSADALGPAAEAAVVGIAGRMDEIVAAQIETTLHAEELGAQLAAIRADVASRPDGDDAERVAALGRALDELASRLDGAAPASALAALVVAVEELRAAHAPTETRLEALETALHTTRAEVASDTDARFAELGERLARVEQAAATPEVDDGLRAEVAALGTTVESVRASVAAEFRRLETAWAADRTALEEMIAAVSAAASEGSGHGVADGGGAASPSAPELTKLARDLERLGDRVIEQERSMVEHFARRERALIERLGAGTDVGDRLAELGRGLDAVRAQLARASSGGTAGGGGPSAEELTALKELLFSRLERLASSIDWRFQRLEGGPVAAAGRTDLHSRVEQLARVVELLAHAEGIESVDLTAAPSHDTFLALVPTPTGHQLVELHGETPDRGTRIPAPLGNGELVVVAVGTSPLPGDDRACVFVEPADEPPAPA